MERHGLAGLDLSSTGRGQAHRHRLDQSALLGTQATRQGVDHRSAGGGVGGEASAGARIAVDRAPLAAVALSSVAPRAAPAGLDRLDDHQLPRGQVLDRGTEFPTTSPHNSCPRMTGFMTPVSGCGSCARVNTGPA